MDLGERGMDGCFFAFFISSWNAFICMQALFNEHIQVSFEESFDCFYILDVVLTKFLRKKFVGNAREQRNSSDVSSALGL